MFVKNSPEEQQEKLIRPLLEAEMKLMLAEAEQSPVSYVNNFLYTFDPKREPYHLRFKLFPFQVDLVNKLKWHIENGVDLFIEKSREMGATYCVLATFLWFWDNVPGSNFLLGSRKEAYVDNRGAVGEGELSNKEESLFGKLDYMVRRQPTALLPSGFDIQKHVPWMALKNPENGNVISGESSNPNFSRSARYKAILMDEFAFWENDSEAWGSTADTTRCRIVLTTPGIKPRTKAKRLRFGEDGEKIEVISFHARLDPRKDEAYFNYERERRSIEDYAREIDINWELSVQGRVYDEIKNAEVGKFPFDPMFPLYVSWDFGLDGTAIQWWQINTAFNRPRLVQSYKMTDKPIHFFLPFFPGNDIDSVFQYDQETTDLMDIVKRWPKAIHYGDPDVAKRGYQNKMTESTRQILQAAGIVVQTKPEANDFPTRKEKTKVMLQRGIEVNDTKNNRFWMDSIKASVYPTRAEGSQATSSIVLPIHNWASHHRTSTEYFAVNWDSTLQAEAPKPEWAVQAPDWSAQAQLHKGSNKVYLQGGR